MIRRRILLSAAALLLLFPATRARAEDIVVPIPLQADLSGKVAAYDRNFGARAGETAKILILTKSGDALSTRIGTQAQKAFSELPDFGGLAHSETVATYSSATELASACKTKKYAAVYLTPGFDGDVAAIAEALKGINVLTISAVPGYVPKGIVLGFDTDSGKSKLLVNLKQAKEQSVSFKPEMLKLMKVYS